MSRLIGGSLSQLYSQPKHSQKNLHQLWCFCDAEKEIFVYIACFFIGEEETCPIVFWKSLYMMIDTAVSNLSMKLLIHIEHKGVFGMHNYLRDMGRTVAEEGKRGYPMGACSFKHLSNNINSSCLLLNRGNPQRPQLLYRPTLHYLLMQKSPIEGMSEYILARLSPNFIWFMLDHNPSVSKMIRVITKQRYPDLWVTFWQLKDYPTEGLPLLQYPLNFSLFLLPNIWLQQAMNLLVALFYVYEKENKMV
ncbi:hypothetical protein SUGI_1215270 [Cryptomeria japonica]|uniref:Disease resistance protein Roq1-like winged-helix domain-containing protein n=1 Tax=Cryptomeria japonica TaxID=3369 RepID=A0AAD3NRH4_CRYJA|nr:hypothetical protein SUGI_1215270 [Cryptomeria japonica]